MYKLSKTTILFILMVVLATTAFAGKRYAVANGDWDATSTWSATSSGSPGASIPSSSDTVYIAEVTSRTVTIPSGYNATCCRLEIGLSSNANSGYLNFGTNSTLNVVQDVIIWGGTSSYNRQINVGTGTLNINGKLTLNLNVDGVQSNRNSIIQISTGTVNVSGDLHFYNIAGSDPAQCQINFTGAGIFNLGGAFIIDQNRGTISPGSTSTFNFNGSTNQTIPIGISNIRYNNLNFSNVGIKTISAPITISNVTGNVRVLGGTLSNNGYSIVGNGTKTFEVANGATFLLLGTTAMVTGFQTKTFGTASTVIYGGTNQTVSNEGYGNLTLSGSGDKTMPTSTMTIHGDFTMSGTASAIAGGQMTINGNFTINSGATFSAGTYAHNLKGNWTNSGTFNANTSSFILNGTSVQTMVGSTIFNNLAINNSAGITLLSGDVTINGTLGLQNGIVTTGSNKIVITVTGSVTHTNGYINGFLQKFIPTGNNVNRTFEVGQNHYSPVNITFSRVDTAGSLIVKATVGDHANINTSVFNASKSVNRHWSITKVGALKFNDYNAVFNFNPNDLDIGANPAIFIIGKYDSGSWTYPEVGTRSATSTEATKVVSFGDFQIGEPSPGTISFNQTGIGTDYHFAPILNVDSNLYYFYNLPSFVWDYGTVHTFQFLDTLYVGSTKRYIWVSTSGLSTKKRDTITVTTGGEIRATYKVQYLLTMVTNYGTTTPTVGSYWYDESTTVNISAQSPAAGSGEQYIWNGWSGAGYTGMVRDTSIKMWTAITQTANWVRQYYLTVTSPYGTPGGEGWYNANTNANASVNPLTVSGGAGIQYVFTNWSGDATGNGSPSNPILMNGPKTAIAVWKTQYYLTINATPGTPSGQGWYDANTNAYAEVIDSIVGTSGTRYVFNQWTGGATGTNKRSNPIMMDAPKTATATWITQYQLTMATNFGTTSPVVGTHWYDAGTEVPISATPPSAGAGEQYVWNGWIGSGTISYTGTINSVQVTMNSAITQSASWTHQYYLTVTSPYGTTGGEGWYNANTNANASVNPLTVSGGAGIQYVFTNWSGDATGNGSPSNPILMNGPKTAIAVWKTQYYLTINATPGTPSGQGWYDANTNAYAEVIDSIVGTSGTRYVFNQWTGGATGTNKRSNPIMMDAPKTATATWITQYQLTMATNFGTTSPVVGTHWYDTGTEVPISATPPTAGAGEQYVWNGWTGTGTISYTGMNSTPTVTMNSPITQTAAWTKQYQLTMVTNAGTTNPSVGTYWYNAGTIVPIEAFSPAPGPGQVYRFDGWQGTGTGSYTGPTNSTSITMNDVISQTANWTLLLVPRYLTVSINPVNCGAVELNPDGGVYDHGTTVTMTAIPEYGYHFVEWTGDISGTDNEINIVMDSDKNVTANFALNTYTLTVNVHPAGSGSVQLNPPGDTSYLYGTVVTMTAHPGEEFQFAYWSGDTTGTTNPIEILIDRNKTVNAVFTFNSVFGWAPKEPIPQASDMTKPNKFVKDGGALVGVGNDVYAFHGNKSWKFYKYSNGFWDTTLAYIPMGYKYPLATPPRLNNKKVGKGASLCYDNDRNVIYATKGNNTFEFWVYDITADIWNARAYLPSVKPAKDGTSLAYHNRKVYLLVGGVKTGYDNFFVYDINDSVWSPRDKAPITPNYKAWKDGSQIVTLGNTIYALKGKDKYNPLWAYNITEDIWSEKAELPIQNTQLRKTKVGDGGSMCTDGSLLYAIKGGGKPEFWCYTPGTDQWAALTDIPRNNPGNRKSVPKTGASLAYADGRIWLIKGNNNQEFWRYIAPTIPPTSVTPTSIVSTVTEKAVNTMAFNCEVLPNPFSNSTVIRYTVPASSKTTIKLFNSSGQLIETLLDNMLNAGNYTLNLSADKLAKGIYFLKFEVNNDKAEAKLIVQ